MSDPRRAMIPGEEHHWWPKSLSKGWCGQYGKIRSIRWNAYRKPYAPRAIGKQPDGHNIALAGPWASSFEAIFDRADNDFPALVDWAHGLNGLAPVGTAVPLAVSAERRAILATCIASLVARNPTTRDRVRLFIERFRPGLSETDPGQMGILIASNIQKLLDAYRRALIDGGRFAILLSPGPEFAFGDGFLHNFPQNVPASLTNCTCIVPISPTRSVLWHLPVSYWSYPREVTLTLSHAEVANLNDTVQVYSKNFIYYRFDEPAVHPSLSEHAHQSWETGGQRHRHPVIDLMIDRIMAVMLSEPHVEEPPAAKGRR